MVSPDHGIISHLCKFDMTISYRECPYGGHMLRLLKDVTCLDDPTYLETIKSLGIRTNSRSSDELGHSLQPFNISPIDEL